MTPETLASQLAQDLHIEDAESRHALLAAARQLSAITDDGRLYAEATALADRHRARSSVAGAFLALAAGIREQRIGESLDPVARAAREAAMPGIGTMGGAADSAAADPEVAEALARAVDLEAAGNKTAAEGIRRAVERHQGGS